MKIKTITNYIYKVEFLFLIGLVILNIVIIYTSLSKTDQLDNPSLIFQNTKEIQAKTYLNK